MGGAKGKVRPSSTNQTGATPTKPLLIETVADLTPDTSNVNLGTERGLGMLERSLRKYGAGRSILTDKHGIVLAGNKTLDRAAELGLKLQVVKTRGDRLVVVQREDLDASDPKARELALADNRVAEVDLEWDTEALKALQDGGVDLGEFWFSGELKALGVDVPDFAPVGEDGQNRLDEKATATCPECGHEFRP